jgi:hypothetical protein
MNPREIIAQAWVYTMKEGGLRRWGIANSFFQTMLSVIVLTLQVIFIWSFLQGEPITYLELQRRALQIMPLWLYGTLLGFTAMFTITAWLFPHIAKGAMIGLAAKCHRQEPVVGGLVLGVYNFFPIFGVHQLLVLSGFMTVLSAVSLVVRYTGDVAPVFVAIIAIIWLCTLVVEFFWIFTEESLVINKLGVKQAIKKSVKLVLSHLGHVMFLFLLLFFIILRIASNLLMVILLPLIIIGIGFLLARLLPPLVSFGISSLLGIGLIAIASYFFAYIDIFRQTVWTITYMELNKLKELDVIEE